MRSLSDGAERMALDKSSWVYTFWEELDSGISCGMFGALLMRGTIAL